MEGMDLLEDLEEAWSPLMVGVTGEGEDVPDIITGDNAKVANECLHKMTGIVKKFKEHLHF